ncbi:trypsin-1-like [Phlebotomus argentipes]|uniref:trypsin-1-like n=1 Tax=Phlebotomus argentipes TaxID=94469 RepID=UPI0028933775|nr:trypsin-1-like [Phlebotomus argentipes]
MKLFVCIAVLVGYAAAASIDHKVVGGKEATPHEFPYMVSLQWMDNPNTKHFCGGLLLSEKWVLTAGHCVNAFSKNTEVVAGAHSIKKPDSYEQRRTPLKTFVHENYGGDVGPHDLGLVEVSEPFEFNEYVTKVNLPTEPAYPTGMATISGWGSMSNNFFPKYPDKLMKADLPLLDSQKCFNDYPGTPMHETNVCAGEPNGSKAVCSGDSGSPLVVKNSEGEFVVYGVTSWTWLPCGSPGKTGVFVNVSHYLKWLAEKMSSQ